MNKLIDNFNIIAEIGVNHEGRLEKALELIYLAHDAGVGIVKFQSYTPKRFVAGNDVARIERVTRFSLSEENHMELAALCKKLGIAFMSTPVTEDWVNFLNPLCCAFKIASGDITFKTVIQDVAKTDKHIFLSTGAASVDEIDRAVLWVSDVVGKDNLANRLTLMHCVSAYPTPINEANILAIPFLHDRYKLNIGYSNHVIGMSACLSAVAHGASAVEVHFTDQKEGREFRDHSLSFDANDLKLFVRLTKEIRQSLGVYGKPVQTCESQSVSLIRKGIVAAKNLKAGDVLTEDNLMYARPATEFSALDMPNLLGKTINQDITSGYIIPRNAVLCAE